jgi:hypothetical protein
MFKVQGSMLLVVLLFCGCAAVKNVRESSPEQKLALATDTYAAVVNAALDLHRLGRVDDETLQEFYAISIVASQSLDLWRSALENDGDVERARASFNDAMDRLEQIILEAQDVHGDNGSADRT